MPTPPSILEADRNDSSLAVTQHQLRDLILLNSHYDETLRRAPPMERQHLIATWSRHPLHLMTAASVLLLCAKSMLETVASGATPEPPFSQLVSLVTELAPVAGGFSGFFTYLAWRQRAAARRFVHRRPPS